MDGIKINTNATLFEESGTYSYSMVVRDHYGALVAATIHYKQGMLDPEMAEAFGVKEALSRVKEKAYSEVIIESDCLVLIQAIRSSSVTISYLGRIVKEFKDLLASLDECNVTLNFVKHSANKVAHFSATTSSSIAECVWKKRMPT